MLHDAKNLLENVKRRTFSGSKLVLGGVVVFAIISLLAKTDLLFVLYFLVAAVLYYFSCMVPVYKFNRRYISTGASGGEETNSFLTESGCLGPIIILIIIPIIIIINFIKNYTK